MRARSSRWAAAHRVGGAAARGVREVGNVKLLARAVEGVETKDLKSLVDDGKKQIGSGVVAIVGVTEDGKAGVVVGVTSDLTSRFNAVDLVRKGVRSARRQGRRRTARHGAGRRSRWRQGRRGAVGDRKGNSGRVTLVRAGRGVDVARDPRFGSHLPTHKQRLAGSRRSQSLAYGYVLRRS